MIRKINFIFYNKHIIKFKAKLFSLLVNCSLERVDGRSKPKKLWIQQLLHDKFFKFPTILFLFILTFSISLNAEDFRIIYSSSLSGNLYSCICGLKLSVGLAKRDKFLKQKGINSSKDILVDTGNSLDVKSKKNKTEAIFHSFFKMGYVSVGVGINDLQEDLVSIVDSERYPLNSANVFIKKFFGSSKVGKPISIIKKGNKRIGIISLTSPTIQYTLSGELKRKFIIKGLESTLQNIISIDENKADLYILLLHGSTDEAVRLTSLNKNFIVIYGDESIRKPVSNKTGYLEVNGVKVYSTFDVLGDKIGILNLTETESGYKIKSSEVIEMNVDKLTDSDEILSVMQQYGIKPE